MELKGTCIEDWHGKEPGESNLIIEKKKLKW